MIKLTSVRHTYPEKSGFLIDRKHGCNEYTFLHFYNSVDIEIDGKKIHTLPHAIILYSPKTPQFFVSNEPLIHDWFHFTGNFEQDFFKYFKQNEVLYTASFDFITGIIAEMENEFLSEHINREKYIDILLNELFIKIDRSINNVNTFENNKSIHLNNKTEERFRNFRCKLFSSLNKKWTVSEMAKELNFSESRFFTLYKTIFGISPTADLINARINSAKNMLLFQNEKIEDIATNLGYENVTHFIRQFKACVGKTPSAFRKEK